MMNTVGMAGASLLDEGNNSCRRQRGTLMKRSSDMALDSAAVDNWRSQVARGIKAWAPLIDDEGALEVAQQLYVAWPDDTPGIALRKYLREVPVDWGAMPAIV
jgi:hypothetical protein